MLFFGRGFNHCTCLFIGCLSELVDWWRHLQALVEDSPLALQADVLGPSDKPGQVTLGLDVLPCSYTAHLSHGKQTYSSHQTTLTAHIWTGHLDGMAQEICVITANSYRLLTMPSTIIPLFCPNPTPASAGSLQISHVIHLSQY